MRNSNCFRWFFVFLVCFMSAAYWNVSATYAQENSASQIDFGFAKSMQAPSTGVSGEIPGIIDGQTVTNNTTRGDGIRLGYTYLFNKLVGLDAGLETSSYTHNFSGDIDSAFVESSLREYTGNFIFRIPVHLSRFHPYVLAGAGAMEFSPTDNSNNAAGADSQFRSALTYGGGADFDISRRVGIRAEYRGATFKAPDFDVPELAMNSETHISHPSIGIYFKLSGYSRDRTAK
jgi:opacity protein-like surface antigen